MEYQFQKIAKEQGWESLKEFPVELENIFKEQSVKVHGSWFTGFLFKRSDKEFIFATDSGGYYKVGAEYMIWYYLKSEDKMVARARWSDKTLFDGMSEYFKTGEISQDPYYQT